MIIHELETKLREKTEKTFAYDDCYLALDGSKGRHRSREGREVNSQQQPTAHSKIASKPPN